jgi:hypothetical protein
MGFAEIFQNGSTVTGVFQMRPTYDDFDDFEFDDNDLVSRIIREQEREERRFASKRQRGKASKRRREYFDSQEDFDDFESYEEFIDYDDDEFDAYSGIDLDR